MKSITGKNGKNVCIFIILGDKTTTGYERALKNIHIPRNEGFSNT